MRSAFAVSTTSRPFCFTAFQRNGGLQRQGRPETNLAPSGIAANALEKKPVRHHIIQSTEEDTAVGHAIEALMIAAGCEAAVANLIVVEMKGDAEPDRILRSAHEAVVGIGSAASGLPRVAHSGGSSESADSST